VTAPDYGTVTTTHDDGTSGVVQGARDRGVEVGQHAKSAAADVKDSATDRARDVAGEARTQARDLVGHTRDTLVTHADDQTSRLADTVDELAGELHKMAASTDQNGLAGRVVGELAERADAVAQRLRGRSSTDLVDDVRDLARRRPGAFLAGAAGLGLLVGRLGRGLKDANSSDQQTSDAWSTTTYGSDYSTAGMGVGTEPVGTGYAAGTADYTGLGTTAETGTGAGLSTPPLTGAEYGTGTGGGLDVSETGTASGLGTPSYDTTGLETADPDELGSGAHARSGDRDGSAGGSGYGA